jgi:chorismate mutase
MTEPVMYFGIGFLVATLFGLLIVVRVHHRTLRLGSTDQFHADVRQLEAQLAVALGERRKLQHEIALIKRDAETIWAAERVEDALFRERINDVANEVVRITWSLETPGSSIEPVSANAALVIERGTRTQTLNINSASGEASARTINKGAPADRLLALRTMVASRAAAN